ncbi:MAG: adenosylcobinamide-GDP ribazoletransferase [Gemmataceae bacterium]
MWNSFLTAVMFLTQLPVGRWVRYAPEELARSTVFFPIVGTLVGLLAAGAAGLALQIFPPAIAALAALTASILITCAFHEDGLADGADGLGGGWEREQILRIMHDSRIGTYGAVALWLILMLKFQALSGLFTPSWAEGAAALIVAHTLARGSSLVLIWKYDYVHPEGGAPKPFAATVTTPRLIIGLGYCVIVIGFCTLWSGLVVLGGCLVVVLLLGVYFRRRLGGITGDLLGTANQLVETAVYLILLACSSSFRP